MTANASTFVPTLCDDFCASLLQWLTTEADLQTQALHWSERLGTALIACDQPGVQTAQEALHAWEVAHLPQLTAHMALEETWRMQLGGGSFSVSAVFRFLQGEAPGSDWEWQLAQAAGRLQELVHTLVRQQELNQLLIGQHAEILQQTWMLFAQAMQGLPAGDTGYDDRGLATTLPAGAALLDARG